jgi:hypothetical protein
MLWLSLALLFLAASLILPGATLEPATPVSVSRLWLPAPTPVPSSSASFLDSGPAVSADAPQVLDAPLRLDLRGNEISRPIARYRVDDTGALYEEHSPQTELPKLKQPVM